VTVMNNARFRAIVFFLILSFAALLSLGNADAAKKEQTSPEVYQAQAQSTQVGKTFNVTVIIDRYSKPEERQGLVDAFEQAGSEGLVDALGKMDSKGRVVITSAYVSSSYDISFISKIPTSEGFKINLLTKLGPRESWLSGRSLGYSVSALDLNINHDKTKSAGILRPACQFKIDKESNQLKIEDNKTPWTLQNIVQKSKN